MSYLNIPLRAHFEIAVVKKDLSINTPIGLREEKGRFPSFVSFRKRKEKQVFGTNSLFYLYYKDICWKIQEYVVTY